MLGPDLVRAHRRGTKLSVVPLRGKDQRAAVELARAILDTLHNQVGATSDEVNEALTFVEREARQEKIFAGLQKLALDRAELGMRTELNPAELRLELFEAAAQARREATEEFSREAFLDEFARGRGLRASELSAALFADLKGAAQLTQAPTLSPEELYEEYQLARVKGVFLRAVSLEAVLYSPSADQFRLLLNRLKFRRLLFTLESCETALGPGYRLKIDGPFSLFDSVTKYGLALAQIVPHLLAFPLVSISAAVRWGKERTELLFEYEARASAARAEGVGGVSQMRLRDEVQRVQAAILRAAAGAELQETTEFTYLPGVGGVVFDLKYQQEGGVAVWIEVLGYWSRAAVWKRIEWARAAQGERKVLFVVPAKLRVSEELLEDVAGAALYVYQGRVSGKALVEKLSELSAS